MNTNINMNMNKKFLTRKISALALLMILATTSSGCLRGMPGEEPPIHVNPNMDTQEKYKPHRKSEFFEDGAAMRMPVSGTVARGNLKENTVFYAGVTKTGDTVATAPIEANMETLQRGQVKYNVYCSPCHSRAGDAKSILLERGGMLATNLHEARIRAVPDGHLFLVASNGIRNMSGYKGQMSVEDRWAVVAYIRALQRSQNASIADVPEEMRKEFIKQ